MGLSISHKEFKMEKQEKLYNYPETGVKPFDWSLYNESQTKEKSLFLKMLQELVYSSQCEYTARRIFCMCFKTYSNISSRRMISDLVMCKRMGFIGQVPHFNTVLNYFNDRNLTKVLKYLIELSALPLAQLERNFAVDASGISLHQYEPWISVRTRHKEHRKYKKIHAIYGVLSNIITSCIVTKGTANDCPHFKELLERTANNFIVGEVSADLAYSSKDNLSLVSQLGGIPYIPFKSNATGKGLGIWSQMYYYFKNHQEEFLKHYHKRSNAETGFFMIKQKFGEYVKSKNDVAQKNEILCKVLCHNLCVLIQEMFLQGVEVDFLGISKSVVCTSSE